MKLAPEPPKGEKMEKDGGSGGRSEPHGQWWEVVGAVGAVGGMGVVWEGWEWCGRAWERCGRVWEGVGDSPRTPEGGQAASGGISC